MFNYRVVSDNAYFNKRRADDRKEWLSNYDKDRVLTAHDLVPIEDLQIRNSFTFQNMIVSVVFLQL